jgi:dephospho-CoA kinase
VLRVGLTGGIGAGKSEVSRRLAAQGAVVIDADAIAREVVAPGTAGLAEVVAAFGTGVLRPDGSLDRPRLGEIVFADAGLRAKLNAIIHPLVGTRMRELEEAAGQGAIVVHDVPLIAENNLVSTYDLIVVVDVPPRIQLDRLVRHRGMTREQAKARIAAQASREQRLAIAGIVIDNSGSLAELDRQVGELWAELRRAQAALEEQDGQDEPSQTRPPRSRPSWPRPPGSGAPQSRQPG